MRVYALAAWRAAADPVHPLDYRATAAELGRLVEGFAGQLGDGFDLSAAYEAAARLRETVEGFYSQVVEPARARAAVEHRKGPGPSELAEVNARIRSLGRILVNLVYSQDGRYRQDPALPVRPLPELVAAVAALNAGDVDPGFVRTDVVRACNRIVGAAEEAMEVLA